MTSAVAGELASAIGSSSNSLWSWSSYASRCSIAVLLLTFAPIWMFIVAARVPPGLVRLCLATPALAALMLAPFCFDYELEPLTIMGIAYLSERLPATKVLAFCLGRGVLQELLHTCSLHHFIALTLCPLVPVPTGQPKTIEQLRSSMRQNMAAANSLKPTSSEQLWSLLVTKAWILAGVGIAAQVFSWLCEAAQHCSVSCGVPDATVLSVTACQAHHMAGTLGQMLQAIRFGKLLLAVGMYCAMAGMLEMTVLSCSVVCVHNMAMAAPFNAPYAATCMSEFWSVRWNIPQSQLLKALVYDPIMEGRWVKADDSIAPTTRSCWFGTSSTMSGSRWGSTINGSTGGKGSSDVLTTPRSSLEADMPDGLGRRVPAMALSAAPSLSLPSSGGLGTSRRSALRRALAVLATFAFSGIEHLVFYWYIHRTIYMPWMLFFSGHGLLVVVESCIRRALYKRKQKQQAAQCTATVSPLPAPMPSRSLSRLGSLSTRAAAPPMLTGSKLHSGNDNSQMHDQDRKTVPPETKKEVRDTEGKQSSSMGTDTACCDSGESSSSDCSSLISTCLSEPATQAGLACNGVKRRVKSSLLAGSRLGHAREQQLLAESAQAGVVDGNGAAVGLGKMERLCSMPQKAAWGRTVQAVAALGAQTSTSISAAVAAISQLLQHRTVCLVMTLGILHATACMGFYGALDDAQLVARVGRALCSMPRSMGSQASWPGC